LATVDDVLRDDGPPFWLIDCDDGALGRFYLDSLERAPGTAIRLLRGGRCETVRGFMAEAAAALQLPLYFGGNWNAFEEAISQYWIPASGLVAIVAEAELLFVAETGDAWGPLTSIVRGADSPRWPVRFVFQAGEPVGEAIRGRIAAHGAAIGALDPG
jgi:hypothetical protein